jgi:hypothetical protein
VILQCCRMSFGLSLENRSDRRDRYVRMYVMVSYIPRGVGDLSEGLRLVSLDNG